ncbi:hypothetical protein BJ322DRAFT_230327 [Thelephora terrestris]|uniref:Uncharacterized protein n=1 Tax=Thelephora terrestris TaxID=56493 RepID=A0A9P6H8S7_9AGAM|nr:hypothetical protein BJ322DRAFT_230327 [Thelephora terrestris]
MTRIGRFLPYCLDLGRYIAWVDGRILLKESFTTSEKQPPLAPLSNALMPGILESSAKWPPQGLRQRGSDASISYRSNYSSDSISSIPPSPTPKLSSPSPRAIEISTAFERVTDLSTSLQTVFLKNSSEAVVATRKRVKEFQAAVADFFDELRRLPDDVPSTPALISAVQGCSFEVHCFGASAEAFRVGYQERQREELVIMLRGAMESIIDRSGNYQGRTRNWNDFGWPSYELVGRCERQWSCVRETGLRTKCLLDGTPQ